MKLLILLYKVSSACLIKHAVQTMSKMKNDFQEIVFTCKCVLFKWAKSH